MILRSSRVARRRSSAATPTRMAWAGRCARPWLIAAAVTAIAVPLPITAARSQDTPVAEPPPNVASRDGGPLDSLLARAVAANPRLRAARARVDAARARIAPDASRPDPILTAGIQNLPTTSQPRGPAPSHGQAAGSAGGPDPMTMRVIGVEQSIPYPGKLSLRRRTAERELDAARAELETARLDIVRDVQHAYYDIVYADRALEIIERNRLVLLDATKVAEAHYAAGTGAQAGVLQARVATTRLGEDAVALREERAAALARLAALLDLPADPSIDHAAIPARVAHAAVADSGGRIRFESARLGSRAADSPLPPLGIVQRIAIERSPMLRAHEARIAAEAARLELARKAHLPDVDVMLQYGQRPGLPDMVSAMVSVPVPIQRQRRQNRLVADARAELAALQAEHDAQQNEIRAEVARLYGDLERDRAQLALYVKAVLPQSHATLESAAASYRVGRADFRSLLDAQSTVFDYETAYFRTLVGFAKALAALEAAIGQEVIP